MMPAHVQQALIDAGHMTTDGLTRKAKLRTCPRCRRWILVGLDHGRSAIKVVADPVDLDQLGELGAVLAGRLTFDLWGVEMEYRSPVKIRGGQRRRIVGEHLCLNSMTPTPEIVGLFIPAGNVEREMPCPF